MGRKVRVADAPPARNKVARPQVRRMRPAQRPTTDRMFRVAKKRGRKRKYSKGAGEEVEREMRRYKRGTARSGQGGKVKSRKQAIAIGLSKARKKGKKAPKPRSPGR